MRCKNVPDTGVSEVVGEMLMIALVVVLLSVFSAALYNFLPTDRDPSISIMMTSDRQNITLWHKGGDWIKSQDLAVIIGNETDRTTFYHGNKGLVFVPDITVFDLGSNITITMPENQPLEGDKTVKLVTSRTVIYSGKVGI
jgi:hypothetical protein